MSADIKSGAVEVSMADEKLGAVIKLSAELKVEDGYAYTAHDVATLAQELKEYALMLLNSEAYAEGEQDNGTPNADS